MKYSNSVTFETLVSRCISDSYVSIHRLVLDMDLRCRLLLYLSLSFERFCITIKCIIYYITGMSVALLLAVSTQNSQL